MTQTIQIVFDDGILPEFVGNRLILVSGNTPGPGNPGPGEPPTNVPPVTLPPGAGYATITPPPTGQQKYDYASAMILDLVNQPSGKPGQLGFLRTAPQIGGDTEAGPATVEWTDPSGVRQTRTFDAPVSIWYITDQPNPGAYIECKVGSTIRLSVLNPSKAWFLDYRTPNA